MRTLRVGLYGNNGHQILGRLQDHPRAAAVALAGFDSPSEPQDAGNGIRRHDSLDRMLQDPEVDMVSLCSPRRRDQAQDAIAALRAGKHVYAEKPCAMREDELDAVLDTARDCGRQFREMGGTAVQQPYHAMRDAVQAGRIGEVVQVLAQKCYPWHDRRPADEDIDGGLAMQAGIYVLRFVEHIAGVPVASVRLEETMRGNPSPSSRCRMAASFLMTLQNGGVASGIANYLNPIGSRVWGYEILRIFGTEGIVESNADGNCARLLRTDEDPRELDASKDTPDYFDLFVDAILDGTPMPLTAEQDLSPTRWVIRAKNAL